MSPARQLRSLQLPDVLRFSEPRRGFGVVLVAIVVALVFQLAAPSGDLAKLIAVVLQGAVLLLALRAAGAKRVVLGVTLGLLLAGMAILSLAVLGAGAGAAVPRLSALVLVLIAPAAIYTGARGELRERGHVTVQTVCCGLSIYLLLGLAFAVLFGAIQDIGTSPFFAHGVEGSSNDFLYFSLTTLTTTGYGDLTAATHLGRAVSISEALAGQIYLVTVLAVIVSNVRPRRATQGRA